MIGHPNTSDEVLYRILYIQPDELESYRVFARERLGFEFKDISLLVTALTHRSFVNEHRRKSDPIEHNERLEYLGDAVLEMVTSDFLIRNYDEPEGIMTGWRSAMVCTDSNAESGYELGYPPLVRLSKGESHGTARGRKSIIADCYEALIGAIYIDQGYQAAKKFIDKWTTTKMPKIIEEESWRDPKSVVQEYAQRYDDGHTPVYRVLHEVGPDHERIFTIGCFIMGHMLGVGTGLSKQDAQADAARQAIRYYRERIALEEESKTRIAESSKKAAASAARLGHHII